MNIGSDYTEPLVGEWKECKAIKRRHDATRDSRLELRSRDQCIES